ncbi:MAG: hypothetical protein LBJ23_07890 [Tannerella sp.]|jgi:hypothetical protein|nr:hypothetical protein [Tannerella sp.]
MNNFLELCKLRQSCRGFSEQPVEHDKLVQCVEAVHHQFQGSILFYLFLKSKFFQFKGKTNCACNFIAYRFVFRTKKYCLKSRFCGFSFVLWFLPNTHKQQLKTALKRRFFVVFSLLLNLIVIYCRNSCTFAPRNRY